MLHATNLHTTNSKAKIPTVDLSYDEEILHRLPTTPRANDAHAPNDWDVLRHQLPDVLLASSLEELGINARIRTYAKREKISTLADLATLSRADLLRSRKIGKNSVAKLERLVRQHLDRSKTHEEYVRGVMKRGLLSSWKTLLEAQEPVQRMILIRRAGLDAPPETLSAIGKELGRTRERVRQLEEQALDVLKREHLWLMETKKRLDKALTDNAVLLARLARDPWWKEIATKPWAISYLSQRLLGRAAHILMVDERRYLSWIHPKRLVTAMGKLRQQASRVPLPSPLETFRALTEPFVPELGQTLVALLFERLQHLLHILDATPDRPSQVVGFGRQRYADKVFWLLNGAQAPMPIAQVYARVGRAPMPDEVIFFNADHVGLEKHFPNFRWWIDTIVPLALEVMEKGGAERLWTVHEISRAIDEVYVMPKWINGWLLAALLGKSGELSCFSGNRFSLRRG